MMTLFDRFYLYGLLIFIAMTALLIVKPLLFVFMLMGLAMSYAVHHLIKHPDWGQLVARVLAECLGLMLMLALFVSLLILYGQLLNS